MMNQGVMSVVALVVVLVGMASAQTYHFCGRALSDALDTVCGARGFHGQTGKRTGDKDTWENYISRYNSQDGREGSDLAVWHKSSPLFSGQRVRRTVVDECCRQPCSYQELESYCKQGTGSPDHTEMLEGLGTRHRQSNTGTDQSEEASQTRDATVQRNPSRLQYSDAWKNKPFFFVTTSRRASDFWFTRHPLKRLMT